MPQGDVVANAMAISAALKRGIPVAHIARNVGCSPQAIYVFAKRRQIELSGASVSKGCKVFVSKCRVCEKLFERPARHRDEMLFCSVDCRGKNERALGYSDICDAIAQRLNGRQWKSLSKSLGVTHQVLQANIFVFLSANDLWTPTTLRLIWANREGSWSKTPPRANWLLNQKDRRLSTSVLANWRSDEWRDIVSTLLSNAERVS